MRGRERAVGVSKHAVIKEQTGTHREYFWGGGERVSRGRGCVGDGATSLGWLHHHPCARASGVPRRRREGCGNPRQRASRPGDTHHAPRYVLFSTLLMPGVRGWLCIQPSRPPRARPPHPETYPPSPRKGCPVSCTWGSTEPAWPVVHPPAQQAPSCPVYKLAHFAFFKNINRTENEP